MSALKCSLCNRPAVWLIDEEPFCEVDKESVVIRYGIDRFPMKRLSKREKDFIVRGRYKRHSKAIPPASPKSSPNSKTTC